MGFFNFGFPIADTRIPSDLKHSLCFGSLVHGPGKMCFIYFRVLNLIQRFGLLSQNNLVQKNNKTQADQLRNQSALTDSLFPLKGPFLSLGSHDFSWTQG
jgi:hypothetical protein